MMSLMAVAVLGTCHAHRAPLGSGRAHVLGLCKVTRHPNTVSLLHLHIHLAHSITHASTQFE